VNLTSAVVTITGWNRLAVAFGRFAAKLDRSPLPQAHVSRLSAGLRAYFNCAQPSFVNNGRASRRDGESRSLRCVLTAFAHQLGPHWRAYGSGMTSRARKIRLERLAKRVAHLNHSRRCDKSLIRTSPV